MINSTANNKGLKNVTVSINGRDYKIQSLRDPEYTQKLAKHCDLLMKKIGNATTSHSYLKLTVLTMLQLAHECFQPPPENPNPKLETEIEKLIDVLDKTEKEMTAIDASDNSAK